MIAPKACALQHQGAAYRRRNYCHLYAPEFEGFQGWCQLRQRVFGSCARAETPFDCATE
jgi:hypothetical protein